MNNIITGIDGEERRKEERRCRMDSLTDALNQIYVTINSSVDFNVRMNRVVFESAKAICCESAGIAIREDNLWTIKYAFGLQREIVEKPFSDDELPQAVIAEATQKIVAVSDTFNDDRVNQDVMRILKIRSTMVVPLITRAKVKGIFFFNYHSAMITISDGLMDFANKAGILASLSFENAELNKNLSEKQEEIRLEKELSEALNNINILIHLTADADKILKRVVTEAAKVVGAESALLFMVKEGGWEVRHVCKLPAELVGRRFTNQQASHAALAAEMAAPVVVYNVMGDSRINHEFADELSIRSLMACPLFARGEAIGALVFHWHSGPATFKSAHINFAVELADSISLALDNDSHFAELEQYNNEFNILDNMNILLQVVKTTDEFYSIIAESVSQLFPSDRGIVYVLDDSKTTLQVIATWDDKKIEDQVLSPKECWAFRLGKICSTDNPLNKKLCSHLTLEPRTAHICVPMTDKNENIGLFHLEFKYTDESREKQKRVAGHKKNLAEATANSIALSLVNFRLREDHEQSMVDPLTETCSRRYLRATFERELHRMTRKKSPLGIIMIEVDNFSQFYDTYGPEAGDVLLRKIGIFIKRRMRAEDIACRHGKGFVVILPESSSDVCKQRSEQLRNEVKQISSTYHELGIRRITLSLGVAGFPKDGLTQEELFRAADTALYRAKADGRDRVVTAGDKYGNQYSPEHFDMNDNKSL